MHLVGFTIEIYTTMHGPMNVRYLTVHWNVIKQSGRCVQTFIYPADLHRQQVMMYSRLHGIISEDMIFVI